MKNSLIYFIYFLSLISSFIIYIIFGAFLSVAVGFEGFPFYSFIAAVIHFGISSWLIIWNFKFGKILGIITTISMLLWPFLGIFSSFELIIPAIPSIILLFLYFKIDEFSKIENIYLKLMFSIIPLTIFIYYFIAYFLPFFFK